MREASKWSQVSWCAGGLARQVGSVLAIVFLANVAHGSIATFTPLGFLSPGDASSQAYGVSGDGRTVVGWTGSHAASRAFKWDAGQGMVELTNPGQSGKGVQAVAVSGDGKTVVGLTQVNKPYDAVLWNEQNVIQYLDSTGTYAQSATFDISSDGSTVAGLTVADGRPSVDSRAVRWFAGGGYEHLGELEPGGSSSALGVSADGSVLVGWARSAEGLQAFRWDQTDGMVGLGDFLGGDYYSAATSVSADGTIVVGTGSTSKGYEAFHWDPSGGMVGLGYLDEAHTESFAYRITADGETIVGRSAEVAFLWTQDQGMLSVQQLLEAGGVDLTGWTLQGAGDISDDGSTIVGWGLNPDGQQEAWMATLGDRAVPEPGMFLVFSLLGAIGSCYRMRSRTR